MKTREPIRVLLPLFITFIGLAGTILSTGLHAQQDVRGESSRANFQFAGELVTSASAKWLLSSLLREPTKRGTFNYTTASGRSLPYDTFLILELQDRSGGGGFLAVGPDSVPVSGGGYGDSTGSSPTWSEYIARRVRDGELVDFYDAATAQAAYKSGLRVVSWSFSSPSARRAQPLQQRANHDAAEESRRLEAERQREQREAESAASEERERQRSEAEQQRLKERRAEQERAAEQQRRVQEDAYQDRQRQQREAAEQRGQEHEEQLRRQAEREQAMRELLRRKEDAVDREDGEEGPRKESEEEKAEKDDDEYEKRREARHRELMENLEKIKRDLDEQTKRNLKRLEEQLQRQRSGGGL